MQAERVWIEDGSREQWYENVGRDADERRQPMQQQAYDYADDMREKARGMGGQMYHKASQGAQSMGDEAHRRGEQVYQGAQSIRDEARRRGDQAYQGAQSMRDTGSGYAQQAYEKGHEAYHKATDSVAHAGQRAAEQFASATENVMQQGEKFRDAVKDRAEQAGHRVTEPLHRAADSATGYWQQLTERARHLWGGKSEQTSEQAMDADWLEQQSRAMFDHAIAETKKFWESCPHLTHLPWIQRSTLRSFSARWPSIMAHCLALPLVCIGPRYVRWCSPSPLALVQCLEAALLGVR